MSYFTRLCSLLFGYCLLGLSFVVVLEIVARKLLGFSLQGADELGGYVLAIGSTLAFSVALIGRGHIRIDVVRGILPAAVRAALDWLSAVLMAALAALLAWVAYLMLAESAAYNSTAPTPWATPLVVPQGIWFACMVIFLIAACWLALQASFLFLSGRLGAVMNTFGPRGSDDEIRAELDDLERR